MVRVDCENVRSAYRDFSVNDWMLYVARFSLGERIKVTKNLLFHAYGFWNIPFTMEPVMSD